MMALTALRFGAAIAALLVATPTLAAAGGSDAMMAEAASLAPNKFVWLDDSTTAPTAQALSIVISIPDQKAYVYRGETLVGASSVSTGKDGKDTPVGAFTILQKKEDHKSNLYDAAPMPFMQRLTWDGVAIHAGRNPGFPASHGCIRVPTAFAKKLFAVTSVGTPVWVIDSSVGDLSLADLPAPLPPEPVGPSTTEETAAANAAVFAKR